MKEYNKIERMPTGITNLDAVLGGGIPKGSMIVVGGPPGSAKTILSQQLGFHEAKKGGKVLFIQTLSEPTVKTLLFMQQFSYFDKEALLSSVKFVDLGVIARTKSLEENARLIMEHVKNEQPTLTIIDSFRVFEDLAPSKDELRRFTYQLLVNLIAWQTTTLLLGEFGFEVIKTNPLFSVVDGIIMMNQKEISGDNTRVLQVLKLRGAAHSRDKHTFHVDDDGIQIFAPRVTLVQRSQKELTKKNGVLIQSGVKILDNLIGRGIPSSFMLLLSGGSGTGKTLISLEFLYRGATEFREKGLFVSFLDSEEMIYKTSESMGWDLQALVKQGMLEILCIPQPTIQVEADLLTIEHRLLDKGYKRLVIDSVSSYLDKVKDHQLYREKFYQIKTLVQNSEAVCFLTFEESGTNSLHSNMANTENLVDGIIELSLEREGLIRTRFIEVAKLRQTNHALAKVPFLIKAGGISAAT